MKRLEKKDYEDVYSDALDDSDPLQGLTAREVAFCDGILIDVLNNKEAYEQAFGPFDETTKPETIGRRATSVYNTPRVQARLRQMMAYKDAELSLDSSFLERVAVKNILKIAQNHDHKDCFKANVAIGKFEMVGLFKPKPLALTDDTSDARAILDSIAKTAQSMRKRLDDRAANGAIDVTPADIVDDDIDDE